MWFLLLVRLAGHSNILYAVEILPKTYIIIKAQSSQNELFIQLTKQQMNTQTMFLALIKVQVSENFVAP